MMYFDEKLKPDEKRKKMFNNIIESSMKSLERYYEEMKANPEMHKDSHFDFLDALFGDKEVENVENAKKLLESKGYKITK